MRALKILFRLVALWVGQRLFNGAMRAAKYAMMLGTTPVTFVWSFAITTGLTFNPLTDWQYETPDFDGMVEIFSRATAVGLLVTISSAGDTLQQESPVQAGGTAGTTPSRLNTEPIVGRAAKFQKIRIGYRNPTGGTITVDGQIVLTPLGGRAGGARRGPVRRRGRR